MEFPTQAGEDQLILPHEGIESFYPVSKFAELSHLQGKLTDSAAASIGVCAKTFDRSHVEAFQVSIFSRGLWFGGFHGVAVETNETVETDETDETD
jgi:hypothetical protein